MSHRRQEQQDRSISSSMDTASRSSSVAGAVPPPPTFSRLPPDGHEFPPDYRDPVSGLTGQVRSCNCVGGSASLFH